MNQSVAVGPLLSIVGNSWGQFPEAPGPFLGANAENEALPSLIGNRLRSRHCPSAWVPCWPNANLRDRQVGNAP